MKTVRSVLLIHNEPDAFRGLEETLHEQEIRTCHAHGCGEARSLLKHAGVDLVLTDAVLPGGTWKDAISLVSKVAKGTPVIVMSRVLSMRLYLDTQDGGAADFIVPPMTARDLDYVLIGAMNRVRLDRSTGSRSPLCRENSNSLESFQTRGVYRMTQAFRILSTTMAIGVLAVAWSLGAGRPVLPGLKQASAGSDATGKIQGRAVFEGTKPTLEPVDLKLADPVCVAAHSEPIYNEDGAVNPNGTLPNVFLYIEDGLKGTFPSPSEPVILSQEGCIYQPHVLGVMVGQELRVVSTDPTTHNTHFLTQANKNWNVSQLPGGRPLVHRFTRPEIMVSVSCNKHPWMDAEIGVTANPFFAVTGTDGAFTIAGLPPGTYTLAAWTATFGTREQSVTVKAGDATQADFRFTGK